MEDDPETIRAKYPKSSKREHVRTKEMLAGSHQHIDTEEYIVDDNNQIVICTLSYPPALYKAIDEVLVNALDHIIRCRMNKDKVTYIKATFERKTGRIMIENNGSGIEIVKHPDMEIYIPQYIFGKFFSGSNLKKTEESIIGGTNGLGAKLTNAFSKEFSIETVYKSEKMHKMYRQTWKDGMNNVSEPIIIDLTKNRTEKDRLPHTTVSFIPDYYDLFGYKKTVEEIYDELSPLIKMRMYRAAAYAGWVSLGKTTCYYNEEQIPISNMSDLANRMFPIGVNVQKTLLCPCEKPTVKHMKDNT